MAPHLRSAAGFLTSGLALAAYPLVRPWDPETGLTGAEAFASTAWTVSHLLGMIGFVTVALALRALTSTRAPSSGHDFRRVETLAWLAAAFLLPYYGAEVFGLRALGAYAAGSGDLAALEVADTFRYAPVAMTTFGIGLLILAVVGVSLAAGFWRSGPVGRAGGLLAGAGAATYLPQFFGSPAIRIGHGLALGIGLALIALTVARDARSSDAGEGANVGRASEGVPSAL